MFNTRNNLGRGALGDRIGLAIGITLAVAAMALLAHEGRAQSVAEPFELFGTVVDGQSGQSLAGAWVSLSGTEWGSLSDDRGRFRIPDMTEGRLELSIERLGYETLAWEGEVGPATTALTIELRPQPLILDGLQVVTDRFKWRRSAVAASARAFDVADLSTTSQQTALDFVTQHTGGGTAQRCNGRYGDSCLFIRGRLVEPVVYIDEARVLDGLNYLSAFRPFEFYMIEVYGNGRHIRAYTHHFMERAAKLRLTPIALIG